MIGNQDFDKHRRRPRWAAGLALVLALSALLAGCRERAAALPPLGIELAGSSVSGVSAGAYMAGQLHLAHADVIRGVALVAGGPWGCAQTAIGRGIPGPTGSLVNAGRALRGCMRDELRPLGIPDPLTLAERARRLADLGRLAPTAEVARSRVYIFSGSRDERVAPSLGDDAMRHYEALGIPAAAINRVTTVPAGHGFVTPQAGNACGSGTKPFIERCGYDLAGRLLEHLHGPLNAPRRDTSIDMVVFDQRPFTEGLSDHGLDENGIVLVPRDCRRAPGCRLHIAFHGCLQSRREAGDAFATETGYGQWAAANRIVVLMPQVQKSPVNPYGCWDWWGYTGPDYLTRTAPQIIAVRRMMDHLAKR